MAVTEPGTWQQASTGKRANATRALVYYMIDRYLAHIWLAMQFSMFSYVHILASKSPPVDFQVYSVSYARSWVELIYVVKVLGILARLLLVDLVFMHLILCIYRRKCRALGEHQHNGPKGFYTHRIG